MWIIQPDRRAYLPRGTSIVRRNPVWGGFYGLGAVVKDLLPRFAQTHRPYEAGFRPWVQQYQMHLPNNGLVPAPVAAAKVAPAAGFGALPTVVSDQLPTWALGAGLAVLLGIAVVGVGLYAGMGYYVGKKMGSKHGWFWGFGGPLGLAALGLWREHKGHPGPGLTDAKPNAWRDLSYADRSSYWDRFGDEYDFERREGSGIGSLYGQTPYNIFSGPGCEYRRLWVFKEDETRGAWRQFEARMLSWIKRGKTGPRPAAPPHDEDAELFADKMERCITSIQGRRGYASNRRRRRHHRRHGR